MMIEQQSLTEKVMTKLMKKFSVKNPKTLNIPTYRFGGAIDRVNFILNSFLLVLVLFLALIQNTYSLQAVLIKSVVMAIAFGLLVNNIFKRLRDITGNELKKSDKLFFAFLTFIPLVNIVLLAYLSYKIGYVEIIKRREALIKELIP